MDALEFLAAVLGSVAWPATVITLFLLLKKPILELIPLLQKLKYKDVELEFGLGLQKAEMTAIELLAPDPLQLPAEAESVRLEETRFLELAQLSPRAAVTEAWRDVEQASRQAAKRIGLVLTAREFALPKHAQAKMVQAGLINDQTGKLLDQLRVLRNQAAHAPEFAVSTEAAVEYSELAKRLVEYFDGLVPPQS